MPPYLKCSGVPLAVCTLASCSYANTTTRGLPVEIVSPSGTTIMGYDESGNPVSSWVNGIQTSIASSSSINYAAPSQLSVGSLSTNPSRSPFLGLSSVTGTNGDTSGTLYDQYARPSSSTSPFGATTTVTYSNPPYSSSNPPTITSTVNGRWTTQTLDGLGHTILTTAGDANGTKSQAESVYGPCACPPLLKLMQQAVPHTVGATPAYTTYTYDGIGRTITKVAPDGASTTTYMYQGNTVTVTDPAGNWKQFTMDAFGNLTTVTEPNPASPTTSTFVTTYTYDAWNNLAQVSMPRPTGTQTRTFTYNGPYLMSATNPENGTVTYTYNSYYKVATKTDARGQAVVYTYDSIARLIKVQKYPTGTSNAEDTCQQENYSYDSNPYTSGYSNYASGRLAAVQYYGGSTTYAYSNPNCDTTFTEMYNYDQAGGKVGKWLRVTRTLATGPPSNSSLWQYNPVNADLQSTYTFDNEGRITAIQYPSYGTPGSQTTGPDLGYAMDTMGRLNTVTDLAAQASIISGATYGPANQLLTISGNVNETRTYNAMLQLTNVTSSGYANSVNVAYNYSSTQNNGKITSQTDNISGEQVVYAYDALNRLASASATSGAWGQSYAYDGFGNLTDQNVTAGSAPAYHVTINAATNQRTIDCADANGNANAGSCASPQYIYDVKNRLVSTGYQTAQYSYAPGNKRVWRGVWSSGALATDEITFWSISGQKLATYQLSVAGVVVNNSSSTAVLVATQTVANYYFGRKLIKNVSGYVGTDRLGSIGHFYPYGQEKPSATTNGTEKFTGYFRDAETTLDYAKNRFHNPGTGRFLTPDPSTGYSPSVPGSWNKYAYVQGDPVNNTDRSGLYLDAQQCAEDPDACLNEDWGCAAGDPFAPTGEEDPDCEDPQPFQCPSGLHDNGSGQCVPNAPPPPTCEEQLDDEISNYLVAQNSPLAGYVSEIIGDAENDGINPLLLVAIAGAESSYGNSKAAQKTDNAFGLLHAVKGANGKRQYVLINFLAMGGDWSSGISLAANVVTNQFTKGNNTVNLLYSGNVGAYCVNSPGQNCSVGAGNVSAIFSSFQFGGGNPNNAIDLLWPCNPLLDGFR